MGGSAPSGPVNTKRPTTIRIEPPSRKRADKSRDEVLGAAVVGLSEHFEGESTWVEVQIRFRLLEDGRALGDSLELDVESPPGFTAQADGTFRGELHRQTPARFGFLTEPFRSEWSGELDIRADPISRPGVSVEPASLNEEPLKASAGSRQ